MIDLKIIGHDSFASHLVPDGHNERPDRIKTVRAIIDRDFGDLDMIDAPKAGIDDLRLAHDPAYIDGVIKASPEDGFAMLDNDTFMSPGTLAAALHGAGGAIEAVKLACSDTPSRVFLASRPPGHHAEPNRAMGFCFFSNAAIAGKYAIEKLGLSRIAVVDFDVHHGNGTQAVFWDDHRCIFASSHQSPHYPGTGARNETGCGNIFNAPLAAGDDGKTVLNVWRDDLLPKVAAQKPELVIISAGFDAHRADPLGDINMEAEDFGMVTTMIKDLAETHAEGRLVSILEGGYDLTGLGDSLAAHLNALR